MRALTLPTSYNCFDQRSAMPDCTHSSSTKKSHKHKSRTTTTTTTNIYTPHYYCDYPSVDLSLEERHRSSNNNYATPSSYHQPYQYQYFPHYCKRDGKIVQNDNVFFVSLSDYPIHQCDTIAAIRQHLEVALNAQAQAHAKQQREVDIFVFQ
jgi:hypothetical protein